MDYSPLDRVQAPLVFGVTGHRDLRAEDISGLEARVREILLGFREQYPSTPFILLSPLAEGADRLVARVALEPDIRARLVVPLPMPQSAFEADFTAAGSLAEFHELLGLADDHWPLDTVTHQPGPERNLQYEAGGKYIARESQILIALWDGVQSGKVGGTAAIVKFQTEGVTQPQDCDLAPPELFPVYHIVTPRRSNANTAGQPLQLMVKYPPVFADPVEAKKYYDRTFRNLDEFNGHVRDGGNTLLAEAGVSKEYVCDKTGLAKLAPSQALTLDRYAIADALAIRFRDQMKWRHRALHWLVFLSFLFFVLFAHVPAHPGLALLLSFLLLGAAIFIYRSAKCKRLDNKRQDYRAIAEACRVRLFWQIAGIEDSVADNYLEKQRTELDWIRHGLRGWTIDSSAGTGGAWTGPDDRLKFIGEHWVEDQGAFFEKGATTRLKDSESLERFVTACMYVALGMAGAVLGAIAIAQLRQGDWWRSPESEWLHWLIILIDAFLAGGALLHHAHQRRAHSELRKQYVRMNNIFKNASRTIQVSDFTKARKCLLKLGREALEENGDWVLLHRERPLELPPP